MIRTTDNMIIVYESANRTGYSIAQYDFVELLDGRVQIVRRADGKVVREVQG